MRLLKSHTDWHKVDGNLSVQQGDPGFVVSYHGGLVPTWFGNHPDPPPYEEMLNLEPDSAYGNADQYGAEAWHKMRPSLQGPADVAAALYELQDLPDQLKTTGEGLAEAWKGLGGRGGSELMHPKSIADHFINHNFGWAPFLNDLFSTYSSAQGLNEAIQKQRDSNGKWLRRKRTLRNVQIQHPTELFSDHYAYVNPDLGSLSRWDYAPDGVETRGYSEFIHSSELKVWCSGEFRYWIPDLVHDDYSKYSYIMNRLRFLGIRVNPALIVKLAPWSWLGDWMTQNAMSEIIQTLTDPEPNGVVGRYAYVMCHLIKRTQHWATVFLQGNPGDQSVAHGNWYSYMESKRRSRASPFGFGLSSSDLSARQLSILAALGISRAF